MKYLIPGKAVLFLGLCLPFFGCHAVNSTTPPAALAPGAVNPFDQDSFKALKAAQASINSFKGSIQTDPNLQGLTTALNNVIQAYNVADVAWQTYHAAAVAGTATSAQQNAVSTALTSVQNQVTALQKGVSR